jgi:very-short-patch-repair endonuclease/predicted transcriptional regulator of viral defense system
MAARDRAKPGESQRVVEFPGDKRVPEAYIAEIVSLGEIRRHKREWRWCEEVAEWIATRQLGLVTTEQLQAGGVHRSAIGRRGSSGLLHRIYRAVYLVGHPIPLPGAPELGAVLACGARTFVSGRSAAGLWGMISAHRGAVEVTVVRRRCESRDNIRVHATDRLDAADRGDVRGIPVTAPARTLSDFAAEAEDDELEAALSEARAQRLVKDADLEAALDRAGNRAGVARMRRLLKIEDDRGYTQSKAERLMRRLARGAGIPQPLCNTWIEGQRVDFVWLEQKLVVQVDGYQFHGHRSAFERDRKKDQVLIAASYRVVRITWLQLVNEPLRVAAVIAAALAGGRPLG